MVHQINWRSWLDMADGKENTSVTGHLEYRTMRSDRKETCFVTDWQCLHTITIKYPLKPTPKQHQRHAENINLHDDVKRNNFCFRFRTEYPRSIQQQVSEPHSIAQAEAINKYLGRNQCDSLQLSRRRRQKNVAAAVCKWLSRAE